MRRSRSARAAAAAAILVTLPARAEETDGAYGRLDGDLLLQFGAGVALALEAPLLDLEAHAVYLSTAGVYFRYGESFGQERARFTRAFSTGLEVRPLFLARYAKNWAQGPARLDLFVDSFTIAFGAAWQEDRKLGFREIPAFEIGLGLEFPFLETASGPFLGAHGIFRFDDLEGKDHRDILEQGSTILFTLSWHQIVKTGLVDFNDKR
ncbi:MAG: hypothetical protein U0414_39270 [Polyangiaceae bacterium]